MWLGGEGERDGDMYSWEVEGDVWLHLLFLPPYLPLLIPPILLPPFPQPSYPTSLIYIVILIHLVVDAVGH